MKRKLSEEFLPSKKRKLTEDSHPSDPSIIIPKLKVSNVSNGIIQIAFLNIDTFYEHEIDKNDIYAFELRYKCNDNPQNTMTRNHGWKSIRYLNHEISCYEYLFLKVGIDIRDYELQFKLRSKLRQASEDTHWSLFSDTITVKIESSLLAHQFNIGDYIEFRACNEYYSREGRIMKLLPDNHVSIRPFPTYLNELNDRNSNNSNNSTVDDRLLQYAELDYFLPFTEESKNSDSDQDSDVTMDNMLETDNSDFEERINVFRRQLSKYRKNKLCNGDIAVHYSRLYGDGIRLSGVIDISDTQLSVDKMILLRSTENEGIMSAYKALNEVYSEYASNYIGTNGRHRNLFFEDNYQLQYIGRFIAKNVCDFLMSAEDQKWKIGCLRESTDGKMQLNSVRNDIIQARIDGLRDKIDGMKLYDIDTIIGFCDLCRLEISDYDWRYNCDEHITNKHDICMTCVYNVITQYTQFHALLCPLLRHELNDDCIQEITSFVVGTVVRL